AVRPARRSAIPQGRADPAAGVGRGAGLRALDSSLLQLPGGPCAQPTDRQNRVRRCGFLQALHERGVMPNRSILLLLTSALLSLPTAAWSQQTPPPFPDGPGKEIVVAHCGGCHDINRAKAGYTPAGWNMLQHMMQNIGAPIAPEDWPTVTTYLTKSFPERPRPVAAIISGPAQASIKLWDVPTIGSRPHDPLATKDG